ncbi:MAG: hypothetical protein B6I24_06110 [Bacteroidetes bacterium 4572_128]|nr:MAG: hypothetical protein B6I24_06110 [Bacteroidetes bacterium 4572_128]
MTKILIFLKNNIGGFFLTPMFDVETMLKKFFSKNDQNFNIFIISNKKNFFSKNVQNFKIFKF